MPGAIPNAEQFRSQEAAGQEAAGWDALVTGPSGREGSGQSASKVRVAAAVAAAAVGTTIGLPISGLGLVSLMFAIGEPSSATVRLTAVGLALIVLGIACIVAGVRVGRRIVRASSGFRSWSREVRR